MSFKLYIAKGREISFGEQYLQENHISILRGLYIQIYLSSIYLHTQLCNTHVHMHTHTHIHTQKCEKCIWPENKNLICVSVSKICGSRNIWGEHIHLTNECASSHF